MIGLYRPVTGRILFDGEDIVTAEGEDRLRLLRKFGVMYQSGALFGSMNVLENVRLPLDEFTDLGAEEKDLVAAAKLNQVGLLPAAALKPSALSGGMQKRAGIARAMALDPGSSSWTSPRRAWTRSTRPASTRRSASSRGVSASRSWS